MPLIVNDPIIVPVQIHIPQDLSTGLVYAAIGPAAEFRKVFDVDFGECAFYEHTGGDHLQAIVGHDDGHGHAHFHCSSKGHELLTKIPDIHIREVGSWKEHIALRKNGEQYFYIEDNGDKKFVIMIDEVRHLFDKVVSI